MKMLNATLVVTLMLVSSAALAERGAATDNGVANVDTIAMHRDQGTREFNPAELTDRNP